MLCLVDQQLVIHMLGVLCSDERFFWSGDPPKISKYDEPGQFYVGTRPATSTWKTVGEQAFISIANWIADHNKVLPGCISGFELINEPALGVNGGETTALRSLLVANVSDVSDIVGPDVDVVVNFIGANYNDSGQWVEDTFGSTGVTVDYHNYFNFGETNGNANFWLNETCVEASCCDAYIVEYGTFDYPFFIGEWSCAVSHDNQGLSCRGTSDDGFPGTEFLTAMYANQIQNFYFHSKTTELKGGYYWAARMGSGWQPIPSDEFPDGHQVTGSAYNTSLSTYPFCAWSLTELKRLNLILPINQMGLTSNSICDCGPCKTSL